MKYFFLFVIALTSFAALGQDVKSDLQLVKETIKLSPTTPSTKNVVLSKNEIVNQFSNNCKFELSCSHFRNKVFSSYGLLKGTFLTLDRINRCDRITHATASPYRLNKNGKMIDHWQEYTFK